MDKKDVIVIDLERLATLMANELPNLDCPECCGPIYEFVEAGARIYQEELEWALFAQVLVSAAARGKARR